MSDAIFSADTLKTIIDADSQDQKSSVDRSAAIAVRTSPDEFARYNTLSKQTGLDPFGMIQNPDIAKEAERRVKTNGFIGLKDSPHTAKFLSDPNNAALAQDSTHDLTLLERTLGPAWQTTRAIAGGVAGVSPAIYGTLELASKLIDEGVAKTSSLISGEPVTSGFKSPLSQVLEGLRKKTEEGAKNITGPQPAGTIGAGIASGAQSFGQMLPTMAMAALTPEISLSFMLGSGGIIAGSQAASKSFDKNQPAWKTALYAVEDATAEIVTEMIPMGKLIKDLKAGAPFFKMLGNNIVREVPGEMVATAWQNFDEWANLNPDKPFSSYVNELPESEVQTVIATMTMSVLSIGSMKSLNAIVNRVGDKSAENQAATMTEAMRTISQSPLHGRSSETMKDFVQSVADAHNGNQPATLFISPMALEDALHQSGVSMDSLPSAAIQIEEAKQTGNDLEIPTGELLTAIAGTGAEQSIVQHIRTEPNAPTLAEVQEYSSKAHEFFRNEAERITQENEPILTREEYTAQHPILPATETQVQPVQRVPLESIPEDLKIKVKNSRGKFVEINAKDAATMADSRIEALIRCIG